MIQVATEHKEDGLHLSIQGPLTGDILAQILDIASHRKITLNEVLGKALVVGTCVLHREIVEEVLEGSGPWGRNYGGGDERDHSS